MKLKNSVIIIILFFCLLSLTLTGCDLSLLNNRSTLKSELIDVSNISSQQELVTTVAPAVVGIVANTSGYESIGTGVCVSDEGYVLTNNHVIENANYIRLYLFDGTIASATIKWRDASQDLAVLQSSKSIPYLPMAQKNGYRVGEEVFAIGTPIAIQFKHSVTKGIISAINRTLQVDTSVGTSTLASLIQHDASINPGNSGGPLINLSGEVIGINTAKITDAEGLGFAIPIDIARPIVTNLNADGNYDTAYLGVLGYDVGFSNGFNRTQNGVYVVDVAQNSPANNIGVQKGDIITNLNGEKVENWLDLKTKIYSLKTNDIVSLTILRNGEELSENFELEAHPCLFCEQ